MQLAAAFTSVVAALAAGASAAAVKRDVDVNPNSHQMDFRTYGGDDCVAQNQGVYTLLGEDIGACKQFADPINSLRVVDVDNPKCYRTVLPPIPLFTVVDKKPERVVVPVN